MMPTNSMSMLLSVELVISTSLLENPAITLPRDVRLSLSKRSSLLQDQLVGKSDYPTPCSDRRTFVVCLSVEFAIDFAACT